MTAPTLPAAPARVGVAPGWWRAGIKYAAKTGHRLTNGTSSRRSSTTLCGRRLTRATELRGDHAAVDLCRDCETKAARAADPDHPTPAATPPEPPPRRRADTAARTVPQVNTAAARTARRAAFRDHVQLAADARDYVPQPYGFDQAAQQAASLREDQS